MTLDCLVCGEPVELSKARFVELVRAGRRPVCRKNGCERLSGARNAGAARVVEGAVRLDLATVVERDDGPKRGNANGSLAKWRVEPDSDWRYEAAVEVDESRDV